MSFSKRAIQIVLGKMYAFNKLWSERNLTTLHCKCFDHRNYGFWPCPKSGHNVTIVSMTFWKKKLKKNSKKWGQKNFFFRVKKNFFLWVMAHWNYGQMTMKTWVELCLDFEHFVIFFCKKMHIYILKIFWINCTCLLNYKKIFWKNKKKIPHQGLNPHQLRNHPNSTLFITDPFH